MAGSNDFTGQNIQDTYQRVLQLSSSGQLADGTGSLVPLLDVTASFAVSASHEITKEVTSSYAETASAAENDFNIANDLNFDSTAPSITANDTAMMTLQSAVPQVILNAHTRINDDKELRFGIDGDYRISHHHTATTLAIKEGLVTRYTFGIGGHLTASSGVNVKLSEGQFESPVSGAFLAQVTSSVVSASDHIQTNTLKGGGDDVSLHVIGSITASGDISSSGNILASDGIFTRDGIAKMEIIGLASIGGIVGTDTNHDLVFRRNNTEGFRLDNEKLDVTGKIRASDDLILSDGDIRSDNTIDLLTNSGAAQGVRLGTLVLSQSFAQGSSALGAMSTAFAAVFGGDVSIGPHNNGNLGVGVLTPAEKLTVEGNISASGTITAGSYIGLPSGILSSSAQLPSGIASGSNTNIFTTNMSASGDVSASSFISQTNITASGNISASGNILADSYLVDGQLALSTDDATLTGQVFVNNNTTKIQIGKEGTNNIVQLFGNVTASGNISSSGDGYFTNVGIGTNDPQQLLHVKGSTPKVRVEAAANGTPQIELKNNQSPDFTIKNVFGDGGFQIASTGGPAKSFVTIGASDGDIIELSGSVHIRGLNGHMSASGNISASSFIASTNITASGNISASGTVIGITGSFGRGNFDDVILAQDILKLNTNNKFIQAKETGGTSRNILGINDSDIVHVANANLETDIKGTSITLSATTTASGDFFVNGQITASAAEAGSVAGGFTVRPNLHFYCVNTVADVSTNNNATEEDIRPGSASQDGTIVSWGAVTSSHASTVFDLSSNELTIKRAGLYKFTHGVTLEIRNGSNRLESQVGLLRKPNGGSYAFVNGTETRGYHRFTAREIAGAGSGPATGATHNFTGLVQVEANDTFKILFAAFNKSTTQRLRTIPPGTTWYIEAVT